MHDTDLMFRYDVEEIACITMPPRSGDHEARAIEQRPEDLPH